eukprot:tig00000507_g1773.t1
MKRAAHLAEEFWSRISQGTALYASKAAMSGAEPIWMFGSCYTPEGPRREVEDDSAGEEAQRTPPRGEAGRVNATDEERAYEAFLRDFSILPWMTYRKGFTGIGGGSLTSDVGWGCMLRSAQMMLATALLRLRLGRDFDVDADPAACARFAEVVREFADCDCERAPLSLHAMVATGAAGGLKRAGEWYGPSSACLVLRELVERARPGGLRVLLSDDGCIYRDQLLPSAAASSSSGPAAFDPVLILVPARLGLEGLNPVYVPALQALYRVPEFVGVLGGRPRSSLYFVACQGGRRCTSTPTPPAPPSPAPTPRTRPAPRLPHEARPARPRPPPPPTPPQSYRCRTPRRMPLAELDPSLALGFLCCSPREFDALCARLRQLAGAHGW